MSTDNEAPAPKRKRMQMTKADWERVAADVHRAEKNPDALQLPLIPEAPKAKSKPRVSRVSGNAA